MENKKAELCGAVIGDGWIENRERGFFMAGDPSDDREYYDYYISAIVSEILGEEIKPKNFPYWGVYGISAYKKEHIKKLLNLGLPKGKKVYSASIPDWIANSEKSIFFSFFRGFFDTDGCVCFEKNYTKYANEFNSKYHGRIRISISSVSPNLMNQVSGLLAKHGVSHTMKIKPGGFRNNRNNRDVYIIKMNRKESVKWLFETVRPSNPKHTTKYIVWKKFGFCPPRTSITDRRAMLKNRVNPYRFYKRE